MDRMYVSSSIKSSENTEFGASSKKEIQSDFELTERKRTRLLVEGTSLPQSEVITLNVGGTQFLVNTLMFAESKGFIKKLCEPRIRNEYWHEDIQMFFFDQDPRFFPTVLAYVRTGDLHLQNSLCSVQIEEEMCFWDLSFLELRVCCSGKYTDSKYMSEYLVLLEDSSNPVYLTNSKDIDDGARSWWDVSRAYVWNSIIEPSNSWFGKVHAFVSISLVILTMYIIVVDSKLPNDHDVSFSELRRTENMTYSGPRPQFSETVPLISFLYFSFELITLLIVCPNKLHFIKSQYCLADGAALIPELLTYGSVLFGHEPTEMLHEPTTFEIITLCGLLLKLIRSANHIKQIWVFLYILLHSKKLILASAVMLVFLSVLFGMMLCILETSDEHSGTDLSIMGCSTLFAAGTLTTVGGGEVVPQSIAGKIVASLCAITGLMMLPIITMFIVGHFSATRRNLKYIAMKEESYTIKRKKSLYKMIKKVNIGHALNVEDMVEEQYTRAMTSKVNVRLH